MKTLTSEPDFINPITVQETLLTFRNDWKRTFEFFNWVEAEYHLQHPTDTHNHMIDILVNEAIETYEKLEKFNLKDDTSYCNLIDALCEYKHVEEAQELIFGKNKNLNIDGKPKFYNIVLRGYKDALVMLDTMRNDGCQLMQFSYQLFFACMEKPREILNLFDRMVKSGVRPSVDTYVMLMRKFGRWGFL
ncbi:pentatricopeptide repeat-containing protein [Senna tora]|uniref:Pentatricopeptide repeat-containing protein n=1 Tax=Senna tora TaxID=362788 RepID=A0A834SP00_9FABA|nr:pentatricopeptide repeat-containing protein [Senna tora]